MAKRKKYADEKEVVRRTGIVVALALFIFATSVDSPKVLVQTAGSMVGAAANMSAGVEPNPYNTAAAQLAAKQAELDARESRIGALDGGSLTGTRTLAAASFVTSILVLVLVAGNYYMDFRRARRTLA
jgi:hypothetical protein